MSVRNIDYNFVRYTEELFYPYFSDGKISVSEMYVALANGFLDPISLAPITIFEYDEQLYCINARRLTIAKELQQRGKLDILERLPIQYVTKDDKEFAEQYRNFVDERLPAMKKKGFDGSTIKVYRDLYYMCCYSLITGKFRDDLDEHIARYHLKMKISDFEKMNVSQCDRCHQERYITIIKPSNKGSYKFIQNYACRISGSIVLHTMEEPWTEVTLREICNVFLNLKENALNEPVTFEKSSSAPVPSMKRSSQSTVLLRRQKPVALYNNRITKEEKSDDLIKHSDLFLLRCLFVIILSWLIIIFFPKK
jgi:hypothetical protein